MQLCNSTDRIILISLTLPLNTQYSVDMKIVKRQSFAIFECGHSLKRIYVKATSYGLVLFNSQLSDRIESCTKFSTTVYLHTAITFIKIELYRSYQSPKLPYNNND